MKKIKELQKENNISRKQIADYLNIPMATYDNYTNERRTPDVETLIKIANFYNVSVDYLCGHETKNQLIIENVSEQKKLDIRTMLVLPSNYYSYISAKLETYREMLQLKV